MDPSCLMTASPADCSLCHVGDDWNEIRSDFRYDHQAQTGVALVGAHAKAECLRCHNDRGPTAAFAVRGCRGCHQDVHLGELGSDCAVCHDELSNAGCSRRMLGTVVVSPAVTATGSLNAK